MRSRVITATVAITLVVALVVWAPPLLLALSIGVVAVIAAREFNLLASAQGLAVDRHLAPALALLVTLSPALGGVPGILAAVALTLVVVLGRGVFVAERELDVILPRLATTLSAALWIGLGCSYLVALRLEFRGDLLLLLFLTVMWSSDSAALLIGKTFGRRKLAPRLSPGKTVAGAIAAMVAGALAVIMMRRWLGLESQIGLVAALGLAGLLPVAGVFGDLIESGVKRGASAKDSGTVFPGHGGALDRLDSLLLAAPVMYHWLKWMRAF